MKRLALAAYLLVGVAFGGHVAAVMAGDCPGAAGGGPLLAGAMAGAFWPATMPIAFGDGICPAD